MEIVLTREVRGEAGGQSVHVVRITREGNQPRLAFLPAGARLSDLEAFSDLLADSAGDLADAAGASCSCRTCEMTPWASAFSSAVLAEAMSCCSDSRRMASVSMGGI
mmetsp:Transcript_1920/g.5075  ORF Transcript_1920/g.5075 Transcript_1920/m.5075 type:complete len:107 (+) Transcript_1920:53-373(+)